VSRSGIKIIKIEESELEDYLVKHPKAIEEGMKILGHQITTDSGPLDILAVDKDDILVVIELKNEMDNGQLDQGLRYYDWVRTNLEWISRSFSKEKGVKIDVTQEPGLILIAPEFSENLKRISKYVSIPLDLMEYIAIELPNGEKHVICRVIDYGAPSEPPVIPTREGHLKYIEDGKVQQLCRTCLQQLENLGIEIRPIKGRWFSLWYKKKRFMYLGCKKRFFVCEIQGPDGTWTERFRIETKEDWETIFNNHVLPVYQSLGGKEHLMKDKGTK